MDSYKRKGRLDLIIGPMFSGKSSELLRRLTIYSNLKLKCLYINHSVDNRSGNTGGFSTHYELINPNITRVDNISVEAFNSLSGVIREDYDVIAIDEAQFFDETIIKFCERHVDVYKRHVIVCGLDGDSNRNKFGFILDLVPKADTVKKYRSSCADCAPNEVDAPFTLRYASAEASQLQIGGKEKYKPLCRECYLSYQ